MKNLVNHPDVQQLQEKMAGELKSELEKKGDQFLTGQEYMTKFGLSWYKLDSVQRVRNL